MVDTILVPVELPDPEPIAPELVADLASLDIVVLGHYDLPEQTPSGAAREQFEAEATEQLEAIAAPFREAGASVRTRLVFGKDRPTAIDQIAIEEDCVAELDPAPTDGINRILVPLPIIAEFEHLPQFVELLCQGTDSVLTLFHVVEGDEQRARGEEIVTKTRAGLLAAGFDAADIETVVVDAENHDKEIIRVAGDHDAVVMYEAESQLGDRIFGTLPDRIREATGDPVIVVRRDY